MPLNLSFGSQAYFFLWHQRESPSPARALPPRDLAYGSEVAAAMAGWQPPVVAMMRR
jgi:hypothetical protein